MEGLSPLARGEPTQHPAITARDGAYPRSRGGTAAKHGRGDFDEGLSPLARGNLTKLLEDNSENGPIPARAGEPATTVAAAVDVGAYPRSRGGTLTPWGFDNPGYGLSPLARGNPVPVPSTAMAMGPIPARAGEPSTSRRPTPASRAYPRSRGGTAFVALVDCIIKGLSPLARGNLQGPGPVGRSLGPIPARAGEPAWCSCSHLDTRAYPRSRGGTNPPSAIEVRTRGLSPLARGNREGARPPCPPEGPIPARAGEPACLLRPRSASRAYPRSRGGTGRELLADLLDSGLSPLARGNRLGIRCRVARRGPIPARAGEPEKAEAL